MSNDVDIALRAYALWEAAGSPHGRDREFWHAAAAELEPPPAKPVRELRGHIEIANADGIIGWVMDAGQPDDALVVKLLVDGVETIRTVASIRREDLKAYGVGTGEYGFRLEVPGDVRTGTMGAVAITVEDQAFPMDARTEGLLSELTLRG